MCDYSLHAFASRLGKESEELVVHRFLGGSIGLVSPAEAGPFVRQTGRRPHWDTIKSWFAVDHSADSQPCAVCIPPGATLILHDIPRGLQAEIGVGTAEKVTFIQTTASANTYRDALRFSNQRQVLLQNLRPGQRVSVLKLELETADPATVKFSAYPLPSFSNVSGLRQPLGGSASPRYTPSNRPVPDTTARF